MTHPPRFRSAFCRLLASTAICSLSFFGPGAARAEQVVLRVMTFNLRYASDTPPNAWPDRRPVVKGAIVENDPDIVGTQEGLYRQLKDMAEDLPAYRWIGEGRDGGSAGEFMAIFYKRERLEPMAYGHFWLSDSPRVVGSRTWGNVLPRMVTWIRFKEKSTGAEFMHWNTHFDHQNQPARERSAALLIQEIRSHLPGTAMIITGDFNQSQDNVVHKALVEAPEEGNAGAIFLRDAWDLAVDAGKISGRQVGTWNGWQGPNAETRRIDWILVSEEFDCLEAKVILHEEKGQWPSDHFPVMATLHLKR